LAGKLRKEKGIVILPAKTFANLQKYFLKYNKNICAVSKLSMRFIRTNIGNRLKDLKTTKARPAQYTQVYAGTCLSDFQAGLLGQSLGFNIQIIPQTQNRKTFQKYGSTSSS
jgi:hypothetical protein